MPFGDRSPKIGCFELHTAHIYISFCNIFVQKALGNSGDEICEKDLEVYYLWNYLSSSAFPKSRGNIEDLLDNTVSVAGEQILAGSFKYLWPLFSLMFTSRWMNIIFRQIQGVMLLSTLYKNFNRAPSFFLQFLHSQLSETFTVKVQSNFCFLSWEFLMCKQ